MQCIHAKFDITVRTQHTCTYVCAPGAKVIQSWCVLWCVQYVLLLSCFRFYNVSKQSHPFLLRDHIASTRACFDSRSRIIQLAYVVPFQGWASMTERPHPALMYLRMQDTRHVTQFKMAAEVPLYVHYVSLLCRFGIIRTTVHCVCICLRKCILICPCVMYIRTLLLQIVLLK